MIDRIRQNSHALIRSNPPRMPRRIRASSIVLVALLASLAAPLTGCVGPSLWRLDLDRPIDLDEDEGLLIMHVDTDARILQLILSRARIVEEIEIGKHLWITKLPAGRYSWIGVHTQGWRRRKNRYELQRDSYLRPAELDFEIRAGSINYAGELIIRETRRRNGHLWINFRNRNHAALVTRELLRSHPELLDAFPLHSATVSGDAFLDFYQAEKVRLYESAESTP
jgi:hypothetical protein